ncbi:MAG: hypothetical protein ABF289_09420 [Clostridiales bacterium]
MDKKKIELLKLEDDFDVEIQDWCNPESCTDDCSTGFEDWCDPVWAFWT